MKIFDKVKNWLDKMFFDEVAVKYDWDMIEDKEDMAESLVKGFPPSHPIFQEVLKAVYEMIETGEFKYICHALEDTYWGNDELTDAAYRIKNYINESMGGSGKSLESWLEDENMINGEFLTGEAMLQHRLAFIEHLMFEVYCDKNKEGSGE